MPSLMKLVWIATAVLLLDSNTAFAETSKSITILVTNSTPNVEVFLEIDNYSGAPQVFMKKDNSMYEAVVPMNEEDWFTPVAVKITWKKASPNKDGPKTDVYQRLELQFRLIGRTSFSFPIYYSENYTSDEMSRLEDLQNINDQYEKYFRGIQIARFYRRTYGKTHKISKRAAKIAFESAKRLAEYPDYSVVMTEEPENYILDAFGVASDYKISAANSRSMYWTDLLAVDDLLLRNQCRLAILLIRSLKYRMNTELYLYQLRFSSNKEFFELRQKMVNIACSAQTNTTDK